MFFLLVPCYRPDRHFGVKVKTILKKIFSILMFTPGMLNAEEFFAFDENFAEMPKYREVSEIKARYLQCKERKCLTMAKDPKKYFLANPINDKNKSVLLGKWTGGDCNNDFWIIKEDSQVVSQYPLDDGVYAYKAKYSFSKNIYEEEGKDNDGNLLLTFSHLFYVPEKDFIIYKSYLSFNENDKGKLEKVEYSIDDYFVFKRCSNTLTSKSEMVE